MTLASSLTAISLFASSGIGDLALRALDVEVLVANELLADRAALFRANYPSTLMLEGDIRQLGAQIVAETDRRLAGRELDILFATPPCQGMSKNGRGKLLRGVRDGLRDAIDPRNQLATFVPAIANALSPRLIVFENVPEMDGTLVENESGELVELLDHLSALLPDHLGAWRTLEFADYGVPQRRQRLISIFLRRDIAASAGITSRSALQAIAYPEPTHSANPGLGQEPWVTVDDVIGGLPPLDAGSKDTARSTLEFHAVPLLDDHKYWWVSNTPPGASAFDNQCTNPDCRHDGNDGHGNARGEDGINQARRDTPIYCAQCGNLLPRPVVRDRETGELRLMKGFTSAYKRMRGDLPASALTTNLSYVCSDQKIHPYQHRALSLYEAMLLHTVAGTGYRWRMPDGQRAKDQLVRDSLGESIPPLALEVIFRHALVRLLGVTDRRLRAA